MIRTLAFLSMLAALAEPAFVFANPCHVCRKRVVVKRVKQVKVIKQFAVTKIYPTYAATFVPPAPVIITPGQTTIGAQAYNVTQTQGYGVALHSGAAIQQQVQQQQLQQQAAAVQQQLSAGERAILEELRNLCAALKANDGGQGNGNGHVNGKANGN